MRGRTEEWMKTEVERALACNGVFRPRSVRELKFPLQALEKPIRKLLILRHCRTGLWPVQGQVGDLSYREVSDPDDGPHRSGDAKASSTMRQFSRVRADWQLL